MNKDIEYKDFVEYLQIVDMMFMEDVKELIDIFEQGKNHKYDYARCFRLQALGMLTVERTVYLITVYNRKRQTVDGKHTKCLWFTVYHLR